MDAERAKRIWEEIAEADRLEHPEEGLREGELTVHMYMELHPDRSENATREYLNRLVKSGKLVKRPVKLNQASGFAYYPAELDQNKT